MHYKNNVVYNGEKISIIINIKGKTRLYGLYHKHMINVNLESFRCCVYYSERITVNMWTVT